MQKVLQQLITVPEVVGSMVCDQEGHLLAHAFPAIFDESILQKAAAAWGRRRLWAAETDGSMGTLDLRYSNGRIISRSVQSSTLVLLCTKAVNLQVLSISLNVARHKIEDLLNTEAAPVAEVTAASAEVPAAPTIDSEGIVLTVDQLPASEASRGFDELGMAAINQSTAFRIISHYQCGTVKKLKLYCLATDKGGTFPIMVINDDENRYDNKIILSRAIERKLAAKLNDPITAEP